MRDGAMAGRLADGPRVVFDGRALLRPGENARVGIGFELTPCWESAPGAARLVARPRGLRAGTRAQVRSTEPQAPERRAFESRGAVGREQSHSRSGNKAILRRPRPERHRSPKIL